MQTQRRLCEWQITLKNVHPNPSQHWDFKKQVYIIDVDYLFIYFIFSCIWPEANKSSKRLAHMPGWYRWADEAKFIKVLDSMRVKLPTLVFRLLIFLLFIAPGWLLYVRLCFFTASGLRMAFRTFVFSSVLFSKLLNTFCSIASSGCNNKLG